MAFFPILILAAAVSMMVIPVAIRFAPGLGLIDTPDPRKVHTAPVPRVGGWGIALGVASPLYLLFDHDVLLDSFLLGVVILFLFGVWDDARELGHWRKFAGQALAAGLVVFHGGLYVTRLPFLDDFTLPVVAGQLFTVLAMIGAINAINHSDGLDGLAGGESILSLVAIAFLGHSAGNALVMGVALVTIGGTLGFLRYNTHPARVFMGDCGSQVLGFSLAFLVVYLSQVATPAMSAAAPLLLLGLPLTDILVVLYRRVSGGMNWFKATRNHLHHRLLDLGLSHAESVVCIYVLQALLVICGVLFQYEADSIVIGAYLLIMFAAFGALALAESGVLRLEPARSDRPGPLAAPVPGASRLRRLALGFIGIVVPLSLIVPAGWSGTVPRDVGIISAALALLQLPLFMVRRPAGATIAPAIARPITYVCVAFAMFVFTQNSGSGANPASSGATVLIAGLALAIGLFARSGSPQRFVTTPTDYLVALSLVVLAVMGHSLVGAGGSVQFVSYAIVLFYGCEVIFSHVRRWHLALGLPTLAALAVLAFRGLTGAT